LSALIPDGGRVDDARERSFDIYSRLLNDRIVFLGTPGHRRDREPGSPSDTI
jgi:hypothetical protein